VRRETDAFGALPSCGGRLFDRRIYANRVDPRYPSPLFFGKERRNG
jgi:hypothetical protein